MKKTDTNNENYLDRERAFLKRHNDLLKTANYMIEKEVWDKEMLLFDKNYMIANQVQAISNQTRQISELKAVIRSLEAARSVRLARFVKSRLLGLVRRKNGLGQNNEKNSAYGIEENIIRIQEKIKRNGTNEKPSDFDKLLLRQLPGSRLLDQYRQEYQKKIDMPKISIIVPVYNVEGKWLTQAIDSVLEQIYQNWELCVVDDFSTKKYIPELLERYAAMDDRIIIRFNTENRGISRTTNNGLAMATGDYITFMDHDDYLSPIALFEVYQAIRDTRADFIYSDEALVNPFNKIVNILFKPDFSPDFLLSLNYINHLMVIRKKLIEKTDGFQDGIEGSQDYDIALKTSELAERVHHIHKALYYWRLSSGTFSATTDNKRKIHNAGERVVKQALKRRKLDAEVSQAKRIYNYRIDRKINGNDKVSIIVPFKDHPGVLSACLESVIFNTSYENYEIIGISNNSEKKETFDTMAALEALDSRIRFYPYDVPFNYSKINNYGVGKATGEHIVLMNNDIEMISNDWLEALLQHSQRSEIGAVGGKLYYPNNTIQHAGVILGIAGFAGHSHRHFSRESDGAMNRLVVVNNVSAVTGALLMVKKSLYAEVGGLDEVNLKVALNDVDFCLKLREKGYINIFTPYCEAYHHESKTRGYDETMAQKEIFERERNFFTNKWGRVLQEDPYYNRNLTLEREDFSPRGEREYITDIDAPCLVT